MTNKTGNTFASIIKVAGFLVLMGVIGFFAQQKKRQYTRFEPKQQPVMTDEILQDYQKYREVLNSDTTSGADEQPGSIEKPRSIEEIDRHYESIGVFNHDAKNTISGTGAGEPQSKQEPVLGR